MHPGKFLAMDSGMTTGKVPGWPPRTRPSARPPCGSSPAAATRPRCSATRWSSRAASSPRTSTETVRRHADEILTRDATKHLIDELKQTSPTVVDELIPGVMKLAEVQQILQMLLREGVPIRQLGAILETLGDYATRTKDPILLTEYVRHRLARTICTRYRDHDNRLYVATLDPALEDRIRAGFDHNEQGAVHPHVAAGRGDHLPADRRGGRAADDGQPSAGAAGEPAGPRGVEDR